MASWTVGCAGCERRWDRVGNYSEYERQAVESRPCPGCGGYTLVCREPQPRPATRRAAGVRTPAYAR